MPPRSAPAAPFAAALALAGLVAGGCTPAPRMCASEVECGAQASCVAGRCVARGAAAAIDTARRIVVSPVDLAYVGPGGGADGDVGTLGGDRGAGARLFLRFSVPLDPEVNVLEAYVLLERAAGAAGAGGVVLHAERIVDPWDGRSLSWARQPRTRDVGAPRTSVRSEGGALVRLDVRALVQRWRLRRSDDFGVAVVPEGGGALGVEVALAPGPPAIADPALDPAAPASRQPASPFEPRPVQPTAAADPRRQLAGPRLELYVR